MPLQRLAADHTFLAGDLNSRLAAELDIPATLQLIAAAAAEDPEPWCKPSRRVRFLALFVLACLLLVAVLVVVVVLVLVRVPVSFLCPSTASLVPARQQQWHEDSRPWPCSAAAPTVLPWLGSGRRRSRRHSRRRWVAVYSKRAAGRVRLVGQGSPRRTSKWMKRLQFSDAPLQPLTRNF